MKGTPHAIGWRDLRDADDLRRKALEVFPDRLEPQADRSRLREKWCASVRALRDGPGFILDVPVERLTQEAA